MRTIKTLALLLCMGLGVQAQQEAKKTKEIKKQKTVRVTVDDKGNKTVITTDSDGNMPDDEVQTYVITNGDTTQKVVTKKRVRKIYSTEDSTFDFEFDDNFDFNSKEFGDRMARMGKQMGPRIQRQFRYFGDEMGNNMMILGDRLKAKPSTIRRLDAFPNNPDKNELNILFSAPSKGDVLISVTNTKGQQLAKKEVKDFSGEYSGQIALDKATKGTLFVTVTQNEDGAVKRVVID